MTVPLDPSRGLVGGDRRFLLVVTIGALALRTGYLLVAGSIGWEDTSIYLKAGRELWAGSTMSSSLVMPLYPLFLAGTGLRGSLVLQLLMSSLCVPIVHALAREIFDSRGVARWAAALMAVEPLSVFYAGQRLTEALFTFLLCAALLALYRRRLLLASLLLVTAVLVRPTIDLVAPFLVALAAVRGLRERKAAAAGRALLVYGLVYLLLMAPWWIHNAVKYGRFVRLNLGDGLVMRLEHNPLFEGWQSADRPADGFWADIMPIIKDFRDEPDLVRRNDLHRQAALAFIADDPERYLRFAVKRLGRFWSPAMDQSEGWEPSWFPGPARSISIVITVLAFAGVAAWALLVRPRRWRELAPLLLVIVTVTGVHVATHAVVRYRAPLMPLVIVMSAAGWHGLTRRRHGASATGVGRLDAPRATRSPDPPSSRP